MAGSWRDEAEKVEAPSWRAEAVPVATETSGAPEAPDPEPTAGGKALGMTRAALNTATLGFGDELTGLLESKFPSLGKPLWGEGSDAPAKQKTYQQARDEERGMLDTASKRHPVASVAGAFLTPGLGSLKGVGGIAKLAGLGAVSSLGDSRADLTRGEYLDAAWDAGKGGLTGTAFGVGGQLASKALGRLGKYFSGMAPKAVERAGEMATAAEEKGLAADLGKYRSSIQSASRDLEVIERAAASGTAEEMASAKAFLATPEAAALRSSVLASKLKTAPTRISEMADLLAEYEARAASKAENIATQKGELLSSPVKKGILPRLKTDLSRTIPVALGSAIGGVPGMIGGAAVGAMLGNRGTAWSNALQSPRLQKAIGDFATSTAPATLGKFGRALTEAAAQSPAAFLALHQMLKEQFPDYDPAQVDAMLGGASKPLAQKDGPVVLDGGSISRGEGGPEDQKFSALRRQFKGGKP